MTATHTDSVGTYPDIAGNVPEARRSLAALTRAAAALDHITAELIKTRVSQINGCAYCVDLHASALRTAGENPRRIDALAVWHDSALFTERERAALALAEALTLLPGGTPDPAVYAEAAHHWSAEEVALIVMTTVGINAWNRYMVATGAEVPPLSE
ncbi:MAG: carboxymuconolactone decarboxylase family protein [Thermoleophilia bacterium]|jgi:AhpD family alkylhydroperoxidase